MLARRKGFLILFLCILFGAAGFVALKIWFPAYASAKEKVALGYAAAQDAPLDTPAAGDGIAFQTVHPEVKVEDNRLRLTGSVVADQKSEVASTANGIVKEVRVECGSLVEKGDVLVVVDPKDAENTLNEGYAGAAELRAILGWDDPKRPFKVEEQPDVCATNASLSLAKANFDRYTALLAQGAIAQSALDQSRTQYETAEQQHQQALHRARQLYQSLQTALARVSILEKMVADTTITAPFSGWVAAKYVSEGERVTTSPMGAGAKVVSLVKVDPLRLILTVPQQYAALVSQGQQVTFTVETFPGKTFTAEVKYIAPSLESNSRSLSVEALVANPDKVLRPGFFASAELVLPGTTERLVLPASAIIRTGDVAKVYVIREGKPVETIVEVAETQGDRVYVKSGITAEDAVVAAPETLAKTNEAKP